MCTRPDQAHARTHPWEAVYVFVSDELYFPPPEPELKQKLLSAALGDANRETADLVAELIDALEMPNRLHKVGVERKDFELVARNALLDRWTHSNPRKFTGPEEIIALLEQVA